MQTLKDIFNNYKTSVLGLSMICLGIGVYFNNQDVAMATFLITTGCGFIISKDGV